MKARQSALLVALLVSACGGAEQVDERNNVPAAWKEVRDSQNHQRHLKSGVVCADCHKSPEFKRVQLAACQRCHSRPGEGIHGAIAKAGTGTAAMGLKACIPCHSFRNNEPATPLCVRCHSDPMQRVPQLGMHTDGETCAACHHPHSHQILKQAPCLTCHADQRAAHGKDVQACQRCHSPHRSKADARESCAKCHAKEEPRVTAANMIAKHTGCTNCHAPHDRDNNGLVPCEGCHEKAAAAIASGKAKAGGEMHSCVGCHSPHIQHVPGKVGAKDCLECHAPIAQATRTGLVHNGKTPCMTCHKPHDFQPKKGPDLCVSCHDVHPVEGHKECLNCHSGGPHEPTPDPETRTCANCHQDVKASAPEGHQDCLKCHDRHGLKKPDKTCVGCHEAKSHAQHGDLKSGCMTCHRPHGPLEPAKPPLCTTCHDTWSLPGLHAHEPHQNCMNCHKSHQPPPTDRASCTGCHSAKQNHYPDAKRCAACHAFRTAGAKPVRAPVISEARTGTISAPP